MRKRVTGKKAVALVMASLMIASMAGCGSSGSKQRIRQHKRKGRWKY